MFLSNDTQITATPVAKAGPGDVVAVLRTLLADVYGMVVQAQGAHWNVKGSDFSQYHELFGEIYDDVYGSIDPLAENILKMGSDAPGSMSQMAMMRTVQDRANGSDPKGLAVALAMVNDEILARLTMAFNVANAANEQGIANFLAERIDMHQKWRWQLKASVGLTV
jgi:starvation-inducible DNA-binding protein